MKIDSGSYFPAIPINAGNTNSLSQTFTAPQSGQGQDRHTFYVSCYDTSPSDRTEYSFNVVINYPTTAQLQEQQAKTSAQTELTTAYNLITSSSSAINDASTKIKDASNLGIDVTSANALLTSAQTSYTNANTYYTSAQSAYTGGNYQTSMQNSNNAENSANTAKSGANNAKSAAEQLIANYNSAKNAATKAIDDSKNKISNAQSVVDRATKLVSDVKGSGIDLVQYTKDLQSASNSLASAQNYQNIATDKFNSKDYIAAKSNADNAITYATNAESGANAVYGNLYQVAQTAINAAEQVNGAKTKINDMNDKLEKFDVIIYNIGKWGIETSSISSIKAPLDADVKEALDYSSQADGRLSAGKYSEAITLGLSAKDSASKVDNRLDTVIKETKSKSLEALNKAELATSEKIKSSTEKIQSSSSTPLVSASDIVDAQAKVQTASLSLSDAKSAISEVENSNDLVTILTATKQAFDKSNEANTQAEAAEGVITNAKNAAYAKTAAGGLGIAGAAGGGFLYWRKKKKNGDGKETSEKAEDVIEEKPHTKHKKAAQATKENIADASFCGKCGSKIPEGHMFCGKCGAKVK